jgi:hypothetical protein
MFVHSSLPQLNITKPWCDLNLSSQTVQKQKGYTTSHSKLKTGCRSCGQVVSSQHIELWCSYGQYKIESGAYPLFPAISCWSIIIYIIFIMMFFLKGSSNITVLSNWKYELETHLAFVCSWTTATGSFIYKTGTARFLNLVWAVHLSRRRWENTLFYGSLDSACTSCLHFL